MLDICRQKAEASGVASRCIWHEDYLESLPATEPFDSATCFLVSHFFMQPDARRDFFGQIAARLRQGGCLVNADLASDMSSAAYQSLRHTWASMLQYAEYPAEDIDKFLASQGRMSPSCRRARWQPSSSPRDLMPRCSLCKSCSYTLGRRFEHDWLGKLNCRRAKYGLD
jgi:hypothetical protein